MNGKLIGGEVSISSTSEEVLGRTERGTGETRVYVSISSTSEEVLGFYKSFSNHHLHKFPLVQLPKKF